LIGCHLSVLRTDVGYLSRQVPRRVAGWLHQVLLPGGVGPVVCSPAMLTESRTGSRAGDLR
jgi:hypothetical protein